jgi:hypothetical protein
VTRHLFNLAAFLSLLLFGCVLALRLGANPKKDPVFYTSSRMITVYASSRNLFVTVMGGTRTAGGGFRAPPGKRWDSAWANPKHYPLGFGFGMSPRSNPKAAPYLGAYAPWWALFGATGVLPTTWAATRLRSHRQRAMAEALGLCLKCGYDLRGSTGRCPECGEQAVIGSNGSRPNACATMP